MMKIKRRENTTGACLFYFKILSGILRLGIQYIMFNHIQHDNRIQQVHIIVHRSRAYISESKTSKI